MNLNISILFFLFIFPKIKSFFKNEKLISEINDIDTLISKIEYEKRLSLILIYSTSCPHCKNFKPEYIKLSLKYNKIVSFYSMNAYKSNFNKKFDIIGVPSIFYYYDNDYIQHYGKNNFEVISKIIDNYIMKCELLSFYDINNLNYGIYKNYIFGFFNNENYINEFFNIVNSYIGYIDKCFYYIEKNNEKKNQIENFIFGFNKQRNITFNFTNFEKNFTKKNFEDNLTFNINYNLLNIYEEISEQKFSSLIESQDRFFILFNYNNLNEREKFINNSIELDNFGKEKKIKPFNFILFNNNNKFIIEKFNIKNGIYIFDYNLKNYSKIDNIQIIFDLIKNISLYCDSNFEKGQNYIRSYLGIIKEKNQINPLIFFVIIFISLFFIAILIFYYKEYSKQRKINISINNNDINDTNEHEEISQLNEISSIIH